MVALPAATGVRTEPHVGWLGDNLLVQEARRPFVRRVAQVLQVDGLAAVGGPPSQQRIAAGIDTRVYYTYPLLFYTSFPNVSLAQLRELSICGSYLFDYVLTLDELLDRPSPASGGNVLFGSALHREALCGLWMLLPPSSRFWIHFDRYFSDFCRAVLHEEVRHRSLVMAYEPGELEMIYSGKAALAKACLAALAVLDGDEQPLASLEESHDSFYVAFQLADDLDDWRVDYQRGHYSYPLTRAFQYAGWQQRVESGERPSVTEVGDLLVRRGVVEEVRALALTHLDRAAAVAGGMTEGSWHAAIQSTKDRISTSSFAVGTADEQQTAPIPHRDGSARSGDLWGEAWEIAVPVAPSWRAWLDPQRPPRVTHEAVLTEQRQALRNAGLVRTTGEALCQVGLAIDASIRAHPQWGPAEHVGVSPGELAWLDGHGAWLDALLALGLDEPPELWSPAQSVAHSVAPGWLPPAVGRYLGHRLVSDYIREFTPSQVPTVDAVLRHHHARSVM